MFKSKKSLLIAAIIFCAVGILAVSGNVKAEESLEISNIQTIDIGDTAATITWLTNLNSDSHILYSDSLLNGNINGGTETGNGSDSTTNHSVTIGSLKSGTTYYYKVISSIDNGITRVVSVDNSLV